jgi:hypothetical protein
VLTPVTSVWTYPLGLQRADLCKVKRPKCRSTLGMNSVTLDWLDLTVILSILAACAVVGWYAGCLMNRFEAVKPMVPVAPKVDVQQIEVTLVNRGWRRWRTAEAEADRFQDPVRKILSLP